MDPVDVFLDNWRPRSPALPQDPTCAVCATRLDEPFGWCGGCRKAFCFPCGRRHFCRPSCPENGCVAGLCVREVRDGKLSEAWGLPAEH
ncbi:MAG TPA: hypothetical protein VER37_08555 [Thermomicrobiales bacterium]|nr:hypothetical protein [Thermomicrobiales bacterium]